MITGLILNLFASILSVLLWAVPTVTVLPSYLQTIVDEFGVLSALSNFPIIGTWLVIAMLVATTYVAWQVVVFANWVYNKIRGSG